MVKVNKWVLVIPIQNEEKTTIKDSHFKVLRSSNKISVSSTQQGVTLNLSLREWDLGFENQLTNQYDGDFWGISWRVWGRLCRVKRSGLSRYNRESSVFTSRFRLLTNDRIWPEDSSPQTLPLRTRVYITLLTRDFVVFGDTFTLPGFPAPFLGSFVHPRWF